MSFTLRKEETIPDFTYGFALVRGHGVEVSVASRNGGPPRGRFSVCWAPDFTIRKFRLKQPGDDFLPNTRKIFFKNLMRAKVSQVR